ncbi:MAG: hypothetical protein IJ061_07510 [Lachnospiraceae bacterium]|nr:hypothetical protein [Lachnospiraceae bacterium]
MEKIDSAGRNEPIKKIESIGRTEPAEAIAPTGRKAAEIISAAAHIKVLTAICIFFELKNIIISCP